jgi:hypothetical protein
MAWWQGSNGVPFVTSIVSLSNNIEEIKMQHDCYRNRQTASMLQLCTKYTLIGELRVCDSCPVVAVDQNANLACIQKFSLSSNFTFLFPCSHRSDVFPTIWAIHLSLSFARPIDGIFQIVLQNILLPLSWSNRVQIVLRKLQKNYHFNVQLALKVLVHGRPRLKWLYNENIQS